MSEEAIIIDGPTTRPEEPPGKYERRLAIMLFCHAFDEGDQAGVDDAWNLLLDINEQYGWSRIRSPPPKVPDGSIQSEWVCGSI